MGAEYERQVQQGWDGYEIEDVFVKTESTAVFLKQGVTTHLCVASFLLCVAK